MKKFIFCFVALASMNLFAENPTPSNAEEYGPCKQIKKTCKDSGFAKDEAKEGNGLWVDCIEPIMKGSAQPKNAVRPLPTVDSNVVQACRAKHPNFGEGHPHKNNSMNKPKA